MVHPRVEVGALEHRERSERRAGAAAAGRAEGPAVRGRATAGLLRRTRYGTDAGRGFLTAPPSGRGIFPARAARAGNRPDRQAARGARLPP